MVGKMREDRLGNGSPKQRSPLTPAEQVIRAERGKLFAYADNRTAEEHAQQRRMPGGRNQVLQHPFGGLQQRVGRADLQVEFDDARAKNVIAIAHRAE